MQIFWGLHTSLTACSNPTSRTSKCKLVLEYTSGLFKRFYHSSVGLSVDESTVGFKARSIIMMFNPLKPTKWGLRVYDIASAVTGYLLYFILYYGTSIKELWVFVLELVGTPLNPKVDFANTPTETNLQWLDGQFHKPGTVPLTKKRETVMCSDRSKIRVFCFTIIL